MYGYGYSLYNQVPFGRGGIDPAAAAYFTATGITGATQQTAIDNLVKGLKQDGLWSKMKAVYPFVTDNRNLVSYSEDFSNGFWNKNGATVTANDTTAPDGTLTADKVVFTNSSSYITSFGISSVTGTTTQSIYIKGTAGQTVSLDDVFTFAPLVTLTGDWQRVTFTTTNAANHGISVSKAQGATASTIWIWGAQVELGSTATTYQPIATTQQAFISNQFKYNLVNPVDSDAAFRLVFNGGWTHSANGATPNGTNGYADTKLSTLSVLAQNNSHMSYYSRTNQANGNFIEMGTESPDFLLWYKAFNITRGNLDGAMDYTPTVTSTQGFLLASKYSTSQGLMQYNGSQQLKTGVSGNTRSVKNIYLAAINSTGAAYYSAKQTAFATIGDGLTDTEAANLYTRVQAFQTALSRQV